MASATATWNTPVWPGHRSTRCRPILSLLSEGLTAHVIGSRLRITEKTVVTHKENFYMKLRVHDRVTAINKARALGLVSPEPSAG
ncbi:response regulator transcription factor [Streptomyces collinus]|uniref:response regulator transcription factor n=1 Tax=Streptomyces collinus TaxID=42684 RepID=UPI0038219DAA